MSSLDLIKYAFSAGEISPTVVGRTDLEKYDLALSLAYNYYVDYRGGLSTRPGTEFCDYIWRDHLPVMTWTFQFAPNVENTYLVIFGHNYIRFMQDGAYVLEEGVPITNITNGSTPLITAPGHDFNVGDWIRIFDAEGLTSLNGGLYEVQAVSGDNFTVSGPYGEWITTSGDPAYTGGGAAYRVYTVDSPYDSADLATLKVDQSRNLLRITHLKYPVYNLIRKAHNDWSLELENLGNTVPIPGVVNLSATGTGNAGVGVVVTAVNRDGEESLPSDMALINNIVDYATTRGSLRIRWDAMDDVAYYNVYRTNIIPDGDDATKAMQVGYLGSVVGPEMVDANIIPDFVTTPPQYYNPFANGQILAVNITNPGSGYDKNTPVTISDPTGAGARLVALVNDSGNIIGVQVVNGGEGYTNPSLSFGGGGTGGTAEVLVGELTGNYPSISVTFQQRQIYAATANQPLTVWGSRPRQPSNFDTSSIVNAGDSYEFDLESKDATPIKHLYPMRSGLLMFTNTGVWQLTAGAEAPVTPTQALAEPQSYQGCSDVPPLRIDADILYIGGKGSTVRLLSYNDIFKVYSGQDVSILANHFFGPGKTIVDWVYSDEPYKLVYGAREDGALINFTIVKDQNVFAWTQGWTKGLFETTSVLQEGLYDRVYVVVKRRINGQWRKYIERFSHRHYTHVEDAVCADSALQLGATYPNATLQSDVAEGEGICQASTSVFTSDDVGKIIRGGEGKAEVLEVLGVNTVRVKWIRPITRLLPFTNTPLPFEPNTWTLDKPVTEIGGLHHLEGEDVAVLADGNVVYGKKVHLGKITLPEPATRVVVGLGYRCIARTLPPTSQQIVMEHRRKRIVGAFLRVNESRGIKVGTDLDHLYAAKERTTELMGQPIGVINGIQGIIIGGEWDENGQTYIVQDDPLPSTILGLVLPAELGDQP